ncbi:MAG: hypothetical protein H6838_00485 [Planctomycetes bacterium]|nr:hypothetical protein [Planctomycetota bacterium]
MSRTSHLGAAPALLSFVALAAALAAQGTPIGFEETYALSGDRAKAVATLIPGTDDWYYYQCRERQDARDFASVRELLGPWIQRHGRNARVLEIENRQALLDYDSDPERAYALLRDRLGLRFQHQRQSADENAGLPTQLDPELISPRTLAERALRSRPGTVDGFTDHALPALLQADLTPDQLHSLLSRLLRPDVDNLPAFVVRDLDHKQSRGFGSLGIHKQLRLDQLEQCAQLRPSLLQENEFVQAMLTRLLPTVDVTWQDDPQLRAAQLQRLYSFTQRLSPAFNSLKAHVLFHYLRHDLGQGAPDKQRFLAYIQLPRDGAYVARDYVRRFQRGDLVNLGATFPTGLPAAGDDSALIRACLEHFFATEDSYEPYATFLFDGWLKAVLAETKLLLGQGDPERWYSLRNDPAALEQLEQRVEITFPPTQQTRFAAGDPVTLSVDTKNVPTLLVKVFAIDAYRYHVEKQKEVDATIELDGVVPNVEQTVTYDEPPLRRVRRTFDLPMLTAPGTYVVEFVGNGISSRAVIHKGGLRHVERTSAAGQVFRVYDEAGAHQMGAAVWFGGREYGADDKGEILVPFSTDPGTRQVVLRAGNRSSMASFAHDAESYDLRGNVHVDREALIAGKKAKILVRPQLTLRDRAVSLRLLQDAMLVVVATDLDGRRTPQEVRGLTLTDDGELVHEITVPERLQRLEISLQGKVKDLAGKDVELRTASSTFAVNGMDNSAGTTSAVLLRGGSGYEIELRGKDGEVKAGKPVQLQLLHRDFRDQIGVTLATDARGRIALGKLADITSIYVQKNGEFGGNFMLVKDAVALPTVLHGLAGETLRVPYRGAATQLTRATFSLLGQDRDYFSHLGLNRGFLELRDLPAGDYWLALHDTDDSVTVRITEGKRDGDWLVGRERTLQASSVTPLTLTSSEIAGEELQLRLANATAATRVHVIATRAMPAFDLFADLRGNGQQPLQVATREIADSSYEAGRKLGDEYRYVLERRFATKFPGNMLTRPSLLVNPWRLTDDSWNDAIGLGGGAGGKFGGRGGGRRQGGTAGHGDSDGGGGGDLGIFANLDYLPTTSNTLANLRPDANGIVHVPLAPLDAGNLVHVLVLDGEQAVQDTLVLDEQPLTPRARHLQAALDSTVAYAEHKRIEFVAAGGQAPLGDPRSTEIEMFDSLAGVHRALLAVNRDADLTRFAFLLQWPTTSPEQKLALYEQYACHELHFFLYQKDREFFDAVVRPALLCKRDKTFLDRWLLADDLRRFLDPWAFAQLNLVEKILLARRLDDEGRGSIARLVREQLELRPVATERLEELFDLAFQSNSLNENQKALFARYAADPTVPTPGGGRGGPGGPTTGGPGGPTTPGSAGQPIGGPGAPPAAAKPQAPATRARRELQDRKAADKSAAAAEPADQADMPQLQAVADSAIEEKLVDELGRRGMAKQLYRAVDPTRLLVEQNYWQRRLQQATPDVVAPSQFWADYATAPAGQPFVSAAVLQANGSFLEMMMALAVLDLPFEAGKHEFVTDGDRTTLKAATPLLLVKKEVTATEAAADQAPLLLGENFFRLDDRYRYENGEQRDAFVTDEFLTDVAYGCQVVVTNPTSSKRIANVLLQVPPAPCPCRRVSGPAASPSSCSPTPPPSSNTRSTSRARATSPTTPPTPPRRASSPPTPAPAPCTSWTCPARSTPARGSTSARRAAPPRCSPSSTTTTCSASSCPRSPGA